MMQINFVIISIAYLLMNRPVFKTKKVFLFFLMMIFFLTVIPMSYMFVDNLFLFFVLFVFTINVKKKDNVFLSLIRVVCPFFVVSGLSLIDDFFIRGLLHLQIDISLSLIVSDVLFYLVIYLIGQAMNKRMIPFIRRQRNEKKVAIVCLVIYSIGQSLFMYLFFTDDIYQRTLSIFVTLSFFLLLYLYAQSISNSQKLAFEVEKEKLEVKYMNEYTKETTRQYDEIRRFKHDYINILSSLDYYIQTNDMVKLSDYYRKNIQPTQNEITNISVNFNEVKNIQSDEIRSIIAIKLLLAKEKKINVHLEVPDSIPKSFSVDSLTLVRMLGIILDNSIEECINLKQGMIEIGLFDLDDYYLFVVKNSIRETTEPLYQLDKVGYSTKGEGRGMGLANLKRLSQKEDNLTLETEITQTRFSQKITIKKVK